jgi:hypothetical protein
MTCACAPVHPTGHRAFNRFSFPPILALVQRLVNNEEARADLVAAGLLSVCAQVGGYGLLLYVARKIEVETHRCIMWYITTKAAQRDVPCCSATSGHAACDVQCLFCMLGCHSIPD